SVVVANNDDVARKVRNTAAVPAQERRIHHAAVTTRGQANRRSILPGAGSHALNHHVVPCQPIVYGGTDTRGSSWKQAQVIEPNINVICPGDSGRYNPRLIGYVVLRIGVTRRRIDARAQESEA